MVALFALTAGLTASGMVANTYRLVAGKPETLLAQIAYAAVMVIAGPSVLFENAAKARREKTCSTTAFFLAAAIAATWSFMLGLFVLQIALTA